MDKHIKQFWVEALRSGKYKQGQTCLRKQGRFCCLGVLCDLVYPIGWTKVDCDYGTFFDFRDPISIQRRSDMPTDNILKGVGLRKKEAGRLAIMNDVGTSFNEIADYIEAKL